MGWTKQSPATTNKNFGGATLGRLIEAYYAPTAVDVVLVLLEGEAELVREVLTSSTDPNDDHYNS